LLFWVPKTFRLTKAKTYLSSHIPREVRGYLIAVGVFALGNSSDAFLVLRAHELGYNFAQILVLMMGFNLLASVLSIPVGILSDRIGRLRLLGFGWLSYALCYLAIGHLTTGWGFGAAVILYGSFYGFTEGTEKALLADLLPPEKRGEGYGALQLVLGVTSFPASLLTGWIMTTFGSKIAFSVAAIFPIVGLMMLVFSGVTRRESCS
jgi:MFS family permease